MALELNDLSQNIDLNTAGILWLTDDVLTHNTPGVYEFNYLLNGILIKSLSDSTTKSEQKANFYLGESFGRPLFLGHVVIKDKQDFDKTYNHIEIASTLIQQNSQIFIFNRSKNTANINVLKNLSTRFKDFEFKNLNV